MGTIIQLLASSEDTILQALSLLEQLKEKIKEFSDAMKFIRPGSDD